MRAAASDDEADLDDNAEEDDGGAWGTAVIEDESTGLDKSWLLSGLERGCLCLSPESQPSHLHSSPQR